MLHLENSGRSVFATGLGPVGLGWTPAGVQRVVVGESTDEDAAAALEADQGDLTLVRRPRGVVAQVIRRLRAHLAGRSDPLRDVPVDLREHPPFARAVYRAVRKVGPGRTVTYGDLARRAGSPGAARAVGGALGANRVPVIVPCHRCLGADGSLTGFTAAGGVRTKARLLDREGVVFDPVHERGRRELMAADPVMGRIVPLVGPYLPWPLRRRPAWDTLLRAIIHQQLSVKAGRTIAGRVAALGPGPGFPRPEVILATPDATLRAAGLSWSKVSYVKDLAARILDGRLNLRRLPYLDDEEAIVALTAVKGIGRWSAQMHLMFHLGRLDVLPVDDVGLQNAAARAYGVSGGVKPAVLAEMGERWRPWRSLASWYLWQSLDMGGL